MASPRQSGVITSSLPHTISKGIFTAENFSSRSSAPEVALAFPNKVRLHELRQAWSTGCDHSHQLIHLLLSLRRENCLIETQLEFHPGTIKQHEESNQIGPIQSNLGRDPSAHRCATQCDRG